MIPEGENSFQKLVAHFALFPGIGTRQAKRFAFFFLTKDTSYIEDFTATLKKVKEETRQCKLCMRYHAQGNNLCSICEHAERRNSHMLLVIEKDQDIESFEHARVYDGLYFVLGNLISIASRTETRNTRIEKLKERIQNIPLEKKDIEIILAFPTTPNGLFTDSYIREELLKIYPDIQIKSLGRGFSTGSDPEYADGDTLSFAIKNRS